MRFLIVVILSLCLGIQIGYAESSKTSAKSVVKAAEKTTFELKDFDVSLAKNLVHDHNALLIDVRTQSEWDQGHVDGAWRVQVDEIDKRISEIKSKAGKNLDRPIVLYCRSGGRAGRAKQILLRAGFKNVVNAGGYKDWSN